MEREKRRAFQIRMHAVFLAVSASKGKSLLNLNWTGKRTDKLLLQIQG